MFVGLTNPKLWVLVNAFMLELCEITEPRKKQLKVEILYALKEFLNKFLNFNWFLK